MKISTNYALSFETAAAESTKAAGVIYDPGIPIGELCWITIRGKCDILLEDGTAATRGYWVKMSDSQAGRADASTEEATGEAVPLLLEERKGLGYSLENVTSGTDKLCRMILHIS